MNPVMPSECGCFIPSVQIIPQKELEMSFNNFKTNLYDLFTKQKNCDVTFLCSDPTSDTGKSPIKAHKFVLSLSSDVFETMFNGEAAKHESFKNEGAPIEIDDIQMPAFKLLLSFMYNKLVVFETPDFAAEFYYAAHKYNVIDALKFIKTYMFEEANSENAVFIYEIACLLNQELKEACIQTFYEQTMEILNSPTYLKADPKIIEIIFKSNSLDISSEVQLVYALERYIAHNQTDDSKIAEKVRPALSHIRFLTLSEPVIAQTTLLSSEDSLAVIECLSSDAAISKMPKFLSLNNQKRACTKSHMEMKRSLQEVYFGNFCNNCFSIRRSESRYNHAFWTCPEIGMPNTDRAIIKNIYQKYYHVWLGDYDKDDLVVIYEIYKKNFLLK